MINFVLVDSSDVFLDPAVEMLGVAGKLERKSDEHPLEAIAAKVVVAQKIGQGRAKLLDVDAQRILEAVVQILNISSRVLFTGHKVHSSVGRL